MLLEALTLALSRRVGCGVDGRRGGRRVDDLRPGSSGSRARRRSGTGAEVVSVGMRSGEVGGRRDVEGEAGLLLVVRAMRE